MANFILAVQVILEHEGGYSDNPADPGGATNFGITQRELTRCADNLELPKDVKDLTKKSAAKYYQSEWWGKYNYNVINSQYLATKIFDMAVNMGASEAHKLVQRCINEFNYKVTVDGILGGLSLHALNSIIVLGDDEDFKRDLQNEQRDFYESLVKEKPKLQVFLKGWLQRAAY
jgi:lysozyme family protein